MSDKDKLTLIDKIIADALEWFCVGTNNRYEAVMGTLYAVQTVLMFETEDDNNA